MKQLRLKQPLTFATSITLPEGMVLPQDKWCNLIGRKGDIDINNESDSEWWEEVEVLNLDDSLISRSEIINKIESSKDYYEKEVNRFEYSAGLDKARFIIADHNQEDIL